MVLRLAANLSTLYPEVPFLDRFGLAARDGFQAVEFLFPYQEGIQEIATRCNGLGLEVVLFDLPPGDVANGELGTAGVPARRDYFRQSLELALETAARLECCRLNVLAGNRVPGLEPALQIDCLVDNLARAAPLASEMGVTLLVEPLNPIDRPAYLVHDLVTAARIVDLVGHPNVLLQYDVYHAQKTHGNLIHTLESYFDRIGHVQIADVPGRHEPGTGEINYPVFLEHLQRLDYRAYVGLEYLPGGKTGAALDWLPAESRPGG
jgi:hydroxypyruvate isomerase